MPQFDFVVENPSVNAPGADSYEGVEVSVNLKFEPSILGEVSAQLTVVSAEGGEYNCILHGVSTAPQPKGPFKVVGAKPAPIEFKNPFNE